mgnify:FL=1
MDGKKISLPSENIVEEQFLIAKDLLEANKFEHYEISSYALEGFRSQHNSLYWQNKPYIGLGASAHSFNLSKRRWNIANQSLYIEKINQGQPIFEEETLSPKDIYNEYILSATRIKEGISISHIMENFPKETISHFLLQAEKLLKDNLIVPCGESYLLTTKGILLSNQVALGLFI